MIRLAIIDDHASYRDALAFMLERQPDITVAASVGSVAEARQAVASTAIDVALVDMKLADGSGLDVLDLLPPAAAALILTGTAEPHSPALAAASGAVGILQKMVGIEEIVAAIRRAAAGESLFTPAEMRHLCMLGASYLAQLRAERLALAQLTAREREVLRALMAGWANRAIADRLCVSDATVHSHVNQVLRKLGVESRLQAALLGLRHGVGAIDDRPAERDAS